MAEKINAEKEREAKLREMWNSAAEEIAVETAERQMQAAAQWISKAREAERAAMNAYTFACRTRTRIVDVGGRRVFMLRCAGKFDEADEALQLTQEYLHGLRTMEQQTADNSPSQEELCARMERWAQEFAFALPEVDLSQKVGL